MTRSDGPFDVSALFPLRDQIAEMSPLEPFATRNGSALCFRRYRSDSNVHIVLVHGSSSHSAYWHAFAKHLAASKAGNVYAIDLRGHGPHPLRRGDIDYIDQLDDDLADLIAHIKREAPEAEKIILGGHSSGGGLALRFAGGRYGHLIQGLVLVAPYLGHRAPMVKKNAGGWVTPNIPRIAALSILSGFGITLFNGAKVLTFNLPEKYHTGFETLRYSFRLMKGMHPKNYSSALSRTKAEVLVIVGTGDEAFRADAFEKSILDYKPDATIRLVEGETHVGILMSDEAMGYASHWAESILPL